jgi:hypothetical protein
MMQFMRHRHFGATLVPCLLSAHAYADLPLNYKGLCQNVGNSAQEPIGDRDGHAVSVPNCSCRIEGGPLDGPVMTGLAVSEWDTGSAAGLAGQGVARKTGGMMVYQLRGSTTSLTMADGKVTGYVGSGQGAYKLATGAAVSLAGKTFTYELHSTGSEQFAFETKVS